MASRRSSRPSRAGRSGSRGAATRTVRGRLRAKHATEISVGADTAAGVLATYIQQAPLVGALRRGARWRTRWGRRPALGSARPAELSSPCDLQSKDGLVTSAIKRNTLSPAGATVAHPEDEEHLSGRRKQALETAATEKGRLFRVRGSGRARPGTLDDAPRKQCAPRLNARYRVEHRTLRTHWSRPSRPCQGPCSTLSDT